MEHKKRGTMRRLEAREKATEYFDELEKKWRSAGLPCKRFQENKSVLVEDLMVEIGQVYELTDC